MPKLSPDVARVAGADHVLVEVAADRDLAALHQRFVITSVHTDAPGLGIARTRSGPRRPD